MANYNKSFNFRNGVQVDDDNFIVNANGLVGIGTSIPTEFLDVHGTAKITGLVTATNLVITGVSTFSSNVNIGSGVTVYASTGIVSATAFYGDASNMTGVEQVAVEGWIVNAGNISTTSKVGIGTMLPSSQLDVVGGVTVSGIVTALGFEGYQVLVGSDSSAIKTFTVKVGSKTSNHRYFEIGSNNAYLIDGKESPFLTLLPGKTYRFNQEDISNDGNRLLFYLEADKTTLYDTNVTTTAEVPGTFGSYTQIAVADTTPIVLHYQSSNNEYMGNAAQFNSNIVNTPYQITTLGGIDAIGVVTAYSFTGFGTNIQGINATNITNGTLDNSILPQNISISGTISALSGIATSFTITNLNNTGIATLGDVSQLYVTGVTTSIGGFVGNLTGIASTALNLTGNPNIYVENIYASGVTTSLQGFVGNLTGTASTALSLSGSPSINVENIYASGVTTSLQGFVGNLTGIASEALSLSGSPNINVENIYASGVTTSIGGFVGNLTGIASEALNLTGTPSINVGNIYASGVTTSLQGFVGDLTGIASEALNLTGNPNIYVENIYASGVTTSLQGFVGDLTGIASEALNLTGTPSINVGNIYASGVTTSIGGFVGDLTGIASEALNLTGNPNIYVENIYASGVTTSLQGFVGDLTGIASEALSLSGSPNINVENIYASGVTTSIGGFVGDLTGIASEALNLTGNPNIYVENIYASGVTTSIGGFVGNLTGIASEALNLTGNPNINVENIYASGVTTSIGGFVGDLTGIASAALSLSGSPNINVENIYASGVTTSIGGFVGNLTGIASAALSLSGSPNIAVSDINSSNINNIGIATLGNITSSNIDNIGIITSLNVISGVSSIGISTVSTRLYAESIGVGTDSPSSDIHIRRTGQSILQVTSDTAEAIISVGRSSILNESNGALIFGNTAGIYPYSNERTLDIVNYDTGNLNYYLDYGLSGVGTGNFNWIYGQDAFNTLMSLTYDGNLGIGVTNPTNKLEVSGDANVTSLVSQNITATGNVVATGAGTSTSVETLYVYGGKSQILNSDGTEIFPPEGENENVNITSGVSTFFDINVSNNGFFDQRIGIGNTIPLEPLHIGGDYLLDPEDAVVINSSGIGIGTTSLRFGAGIEAVDVDGLFGAVGIGTTNLDNPIGTKLLVNGPARVISGDVSVGINTSNGLVLTSANGTKYRLIVSDVGVLSVVLVP